MPQDQLFAEISQIGYPAVEIWGRGDDFPNFCEAADNHGLRVVSISGHDSLPDGLNIAANHARLAEQLTESIDVAAASGG